ncbi:hypothetical protein K435DRAFT_608963, partial [Dendrothele bispora CBS 962.96]
MTKSYASATSQEFHVYYSEDSVTMNDERHVLVGVAAEDAWNAEIKKGAQDLSGRLGLVIGMPVIIVENIAVELNVSNGTRGTLVGVKYYTKGSRRFAVTADVRIPNFVNPDSSAPDRDVVSLGTTSKP